MYNVYSTVPYSSFLGMWRASSVSDALDADYKLQSMQKSVYLLPGQAQIALYNIYSCIEALTGSIGRFQPKPHKNIIT